jgi:hypothetical protein
MEIEHSEGMCYLATMLLKSFGVVKDCAATVAFDFLDLRQEPQPPSVREERNGE